MGSVITPSAHHCCMGIAPAGHVPAAHLKVIASPWRAYSLSTSLYLKAMFRGAMTTLSAVQGSAGERKDGHGVVGKNGHDR